MVRTGVQSILASLGLFFSYANAQTPSSAPPDGLDRTARAAIVQEAAKDLRDSYVFPDAGVRAADAIQAALDAGAYTGLNSPQAFADGMTADLQRVTHDKHLHVYAPPRSDPAAHVAQQPRSIEEGGIVRADRLAGNVGYIEILGFPPAGPFRPALDRAMKALANAKALIIDLRRNGGGAADAEVYLVSYFLPKGAQPVTVDRLIFRNPGTDTFHTMDFPSSNTPVSLSGKPLYVLTSHNTFSAAEALAYDLRALGLCKIVGETTAGGANPGGTVPIGSGFTMFVPHGHASNPRTGTNWEGVGIAPDISSPAADALKVALEELGQKPEAAGIDTLSQARLFMPRTKRQPGSEAAVRHMINELRLGQPHYERLSDEEAKFVRENLPTLHDLYTRLGKIRAVTFVQVNGSADVYDVQLRGGSVRIEITLDSHGKTAWVQGDRVRQN